MSNAKIRISWDNPNLRATFVKIFRKQTVFNEDTLPEVYATVPYGTNFYDDFNIEYNQDYYYMLACVHDEQKIFTECYYIKPVRDVSKTLTVQFVFFVPSVMNTEWNANTGEFRLHKGSISYQTAGTSLKVYANPFRKSSDGAFYFELICTAVIGSSGTSWARLLEDNLIGLMQEGASVNVNSESSSGGVYFYNQGYGRYILRNNFGNKSIEGVGGNLTTGGSWTKKIDNYLMELGDVIGIGIKANGTSTEVYLWLNGILLGLVFSIPGTNINLRPLIIFYIENNIIKSTYYKCPRNLSYLPSGYQSWLVAES